MALDLPPGVTLVTGRNGQGKTSVLEAAYLAATGRSFRTTRTEEVVDRGGGPLKVSAEVRGLVGASTIGVVIAEGQRRLLVDGIERPIGAFLGRLDVVALATDASRMLRDGPEGRRRFLDSGIVGLRPGYLSDLGEYRRVLAERNALLRRARAGRELDAWDDRLAATGSRIQAQRRAYVLELACRLGAAERALLADGEEIRIRYRPSPEPSIADAPLDDTIREALKRGRSRDLTLGFTAEGPHRDDVATTFSGADIRVFGSAGQLRSTMIALCAGKLGLLRERHQESPLFLMDDFDSDLDESKVRALVDFLREGAFQALLATAKDGYLDRLGFSFPAFRMEGGLARAA
jgi:DNA replication and repair protein RecF